MGEYVEVRLKVPRWLWEATIDAVSFGDRDEAEAFLRVVLQDGVRGTLMELVEKSVNVRKKERGLKYVLENGDKHYEAMERALKKFLGDEEEWGSL